MPMPKDLNRPFPIQLEVEFLDRVSEPVREKRAKSVSEIIRAALERYDFSNIVVVRPSQLTISVRLPAEIRKALKKVAREKHTSVGQLVRTAVEAYLPQLESEAIEALDMPIPHVELPGTEPLANVSPAAPSGESAAPPPPATKRAPRRRKPKRVVRPSKKTKAPPQKPVRGKTTVAGLKRARPRRKR
jgi:Arc/MetJ-type ribon-helix-helix transcriptional regulator